MLLLTTFDRLEYANIPAINPTKAHQKRPTPTEPAGCGSAAVGLPYGGHQRESSAGPGLRPEAERPKGASTYRRAMRRIDQAAEALAQRLLGFALDGNAPDAVALAAEHDAP
jgi:hypothetical protein